MFQLSFCLLVLVGFSSGLRVEREDIEYAQACNATWNPNFVGKLDKCHVGCAKGYECSKDYCCPTKAVVCGQSADSGHEVRDLEHEGRFYYDKDLKNCMKFSFFGASESFNNFVKFSDCKRFCFGV